MASLFKLSGWSKVILSLSGGLIIGYITYLLLNRRDKQIAADKKALAERKKRDTSSRVLVLGLKGAGKSTILSRTKNDTEDVKPTEGFNVICLQTSRAVLNIWEIGGSDGLRAYWTNFMKDTDLLVYVVDAADESRLSVSEFEFRKLLKEEKLKGVPVLLLVNKQDLPDAKLPFEIEKQFGCLKGNSHGRLIRTLGTTATKEIPPHASIWEAEHLMVTMSAKKQAMPC